MGVMLELQRCTDKQQWDEYVLDSGGHPLQLWSWGQVKAGHGWVAERVFAFRDDEIVAAAQILVRSLPPPLRAFAYVPRGPVLPQELGKTRKYSASATSEKSSDDSADSEAESSQSGTLEQTQEEFLQALAKFVKREHHAVALSVEPDAYAFDKPRGWTRSMNKILPAETILLDLRKSESDILADMAKKTRQYIRKSAADVTIKQVRTREGLEQCLEIYQQTARRAGFNLHSQQYYLDVYIQMQDHSPIFGAYVGDELVAFLWLAISGETSYELYGGVNELGQELRANYALKWFAIRKVREWGLRKYDFGGLVAGGVANFKHGWSPDATLFAGTFDRPLSPLYPLWSKGLPFAKKTLQKVRRR